MLKLILRLLLISLQISICPTTEASISNDLNHFFDSAGYASNASTPSHFESQAAGYYTSGSLFLRNQVRNLQLVHIDTPTFRSGCGGIDLYAGGLSYIKSDELVKFSKNILSAGAGYALNLAMETTVPELAHAMQYMQTLAQRVNSRNLNSCELAEDTVGGLWPHIRASQQQICQDIGLHNSAFSDWASARQGCTSGTDFDNQMQTASRDKRYAHQVVYNTNLIWKALQSNAFLSQDQALAELFMSLSGTVIVQKDGSMDTKPSLIEKPSLLNALLNGGEATIYQCDETSKCLNVSKKTITIPSDNGLMQQVASMIISIVTQAKSGLALTDLQKGFIETVNIPILKYVNVALSSNLGTLAFDLTNYSELIAKDLLKQYLSDALKTIRNSLSGHDYPNQKDLLQALNHALLSVTELTTKTHQDLQDTMALTQNMQALEAQVASQLSESLKENLKLGGRS